MKTIIKTNKDFMLYHDALLKNQNKFICTELVDGEEVICFKVNKLTLAVSMFNVLIS